MSEVERDRLRQEASLLEASMADARKEHANGDLDDEDLKVLIERDSQRLAEVQARITAHEALETEPTGASHGNDVRDQHSERAKPRQASRRNRGPIVVGAVLVVIVAVVVLASSLGRGGTASTNSKQVSTLLSKAAELVGQGNVAQALPLYSEVLALDPNQSEALSQRGWLTFEAGTAAKSPTLVAQGERDVRASVAADPRAFAGHLYLGIIELTVHHDASAALAQFNAFDSGHPPAYLQSVAQPYVTQAKAQLDRSAPASTP